MASRLGLSQQTSGNRECAETTRDNRQCAQRMRAPGSVNLLDQELVARAENGVMLIEVNVKGVVADGADPFQSGTPAFPHTVAVSRCCSARKQQEREETSPDNYVSR